jgi:hypothetical protein
MSLNNFLKQLSTGDEIKDFDHAAKLFVDSGMRLAPKSKFLYHVFFDITSSAGVSTRSTTEIIEAGMLVKDVGLPTYQIDVKKYNSYNRTNLAQSKINYNPVTLTFHDDMANVVRELWYDYYNYYYADSRQVESVYERSHKYNSSPRPEFGYSANAAYPFFKAIRIYQLHKKQFSEYTLINPIITEFQHGQMTAGDSDPVDHKMTVQFETVKYAKGFVSSNTVKGFGELHYDQSPSPITPAGGGTRSIVGPGGLLDTISDVTTDLAEGNFLGAAFTAVRAAENFKGADFEEIAKSEFKTTIRDILQGKNPAQRIYTPTNRNSTTTPTTVATQYPPDAG